MAQTTVAAQLAETGRMDGGDPCSSCPLGPVSLCRSLPEAERQELLALQATVRLGGHETLFNEGDPALHVFIPLAGAVKLYKMMPDGRRQITGFFFRGDLFGFSAGTVHTTTAEAIVPCVLCRLPVARLEGLLTRAPVLERLVWGRALASLARFEEQVLLLGRKSAPEKLASFLTGISDRAVARGDVASPVLVPMGRADIADYLGLTIETVSRTLTRFRHEGLIDLPRPGTMVLRDAARLRRLADGLDTLG
ncbi:Crp/Fnr family transcriptional regulator [Pararhodospirillum oryzae]|uniref:Crp/Fnr family transcriptional regulator n=1 Tax=Pararhodospirillum oryzae TaxID=478448 RepID=A0A512H6I5_9PROT|nr:cyclic nucleotide-binding domain-containing protein [Pararhodospirillum oryzae]GEO81063.1 Crp/Fnr family transcriptional regulator [Pararhodospirillum oryzae]